MCLKGELGAVHFFVRTVRLCVSIVFPLTRSKTAKLRLGLTDCYAMEVVVLFYHQKMGTAESPSFTHFLQLQKCLLLLLNLLLEMLIFFGCCRTSSIQLYETILEPGYGVNNFNLTGNSSRSQNWPWALFSFKRVLTYHPFIDLEESRDPCFIRFWWLRIDNIKVFLWNFVSWPVVTSWANDLAQFVDRFLLHLEKKGA